MEIDAFLTKLQKCRYFEAYTDAAAAKAIKAIRKRHAAGMVGEDKRYFDRFPGLSLVVADVDHEMSGYDDLKDVLQLGDASSGMFNPRAIRIRRKPGENRYRLAFTVNGTKQVMALEDESWIPNAFFEQLDKLTASECSGLMFQTVEYPDPGQSAFYVWCTPRASRAIVRAGLVPSEKHPLDPPEEPAEQPAEEPTESMPGLRARPTPAAVEPTEFAPPADAARAERMGVYRKGKWRIPTFSVKTLARREEVEATDAESVAGDELKNLMKWTFDLLCAVHCGFADIGDATFYASKVIRLADRSLFGAWRVGHVEDGVVLTEATARKELMWSFELQWGCAAAVCLGDRSAMHRFLEYPCGEVYRENMDDELAYYRLVSDVVLKRDRWDWDEQVQIIDHEKAFEERFINLLGCLESLKTDDEKLFQKSIRKFGTKPKFQPPFWFGGVVDCDVTLLAELAREKGWRSDEFSVHLQDRILAPANVNRFDTSDAPPA